MTVVDLDRQAIEHARQDFAKNGAGHQLEVVLDQGMHRHLRFRAPGRGYCYGFDVVTWPGFLAITGDMGASVFSRLPDMFTFFRPSYGEAEPGERLVINPSYWSEKLVANDGRCRRFDPAARDLLLTRLVSDFDREVDDTDEEDPIGRLGELGTIRTRLAAACSECNDTDSVLRALDEFEHHCDDGRRVFRVTDVGEYSRSLEVWHFHFIWRLLAIAHAVKAYDAHRIQRAHALQGVVPDDFTTALDLLPPRRRRGDLQWPVGSWEAAVQDGVAAATFNSIKPRAMGAAIANDGSFPAGVLVGSVRWPAPITLGPEDEIEVTIKPAPKP